MSRRVERDTALVQHVYSTFSQRPATSAERLGWNSESDQQRNFNTLLDMVKDAGLDLPSLAVHDAGCGHGDLIDALVARGGVRSYVGSDLLDGTVAEARERHPGHEFHCLDLANGPKLNADLTLCFGALAFYRPRAVAALLERMWSTSHRALGFITWWNLTPDYMYAEQAEQLRKNVHRFIREARPAYIRSRIGDYGNPVEAAFLLVK